MKILFSFRSKSIVSGAILIAFFSFISRFLGVIRARLFAENFGASNELDIFYLSFRIPDLIFAILMLGGTSSILIPMLSELIFKKKLATEKINKLISNSINFTFSFVTLLILLTMVSLPKLAHLIAPTLDEQSQQKFVILTGIMLAQPLFLVLSDLFSSILQVHKIFISYSLAPALYNIGIIIGVAFLSKIFAIYGLAIGVVLGAFLHMIIHTFFLKQVNFKYFLYWNFRDKRLYKIMKLSLLRSLGLLFFQLNSVVINSLASRFGEGYVSILNYAFDIEYLPYGIIGIAFATSSFAYLSDLNSSKQRHQFALTLTKSLHNALFLILPLVFIFYILREEIVRVLLYIGKFEEKDVLIASKFIGITIFAVPFQSLVPILTKAFYAIKNTRVPIIINGVSLLITVAVSFYLSFYLRLDFWGLAYGILVSTIINALLGFILLKTKLPSFNFKIFITQMAKMLISSIIMALVSFILNIYFKKFLNFNISAIFIRGMISAIFSLLVYLAVNFMLKNEQTLKIYDKIKYILKTKTITF